METMRSQEIRKAIDEQIGAIKAYADGFEVCVPKDEVALGEIAGILKTVAQHVGEMDEARIRRRRLMGELNNALSNLETSQKKYAESIKNSP